MKAPFVSERPAFITSSSGTTVGGIVKGVVATNESILSQLFSVCNSDIQYSKGSVILNHFPPTAATSLNSLFLVGFMSGSTILIDPRATENDFYNQLTIQKPNFCINTASSWEVFFNRVDAEMKLGIKFDFSYAIGWVIGGEGTDSKKLRKWNSILAQCGAVRIYCGYGLSESFSGIGIDNINCASSTNKQISGGGLIQAGMIAGVFDNNGNELKYNQRGELRIKTKAAMKCYYNKPELTDKTIVNGWIHTGDLVEIDENGFVYIWGRLTDKVDVTNEKSVYLFDIANEIKKKDYINDAIVLSMATNQNEHTFVAHIVWEDEPSEEEKKNRIEELNAAIKEYSQGDYEIAGYYEHKTMLPYSPTTLKKDKNKMSQQTTGFIQVVDGKLCNIGFEPNNGERYKVAERD